MAPRSRPRPVQLSPAVEANVRDGVEQAMRGEFVDMSAKEKQRYLDTGEVPERIQRWLASPNTPRDT